MTTIPETSHDFSSYALPAIFDAGLSADALVQKLLVVIDAYYNDRRAEALAKQVEHDNGPHGGMCRCLGPLRMFEMHMRRDSSPMEQYLYEVLLANGLDDALKKMLGSPSTQFYERVSPKLIAKYDRGEVARFIYSDNYLMQFDRRDSPLEQFYKICREENANACLSELKKRFRTLTTRYERALQSAA